MVVIHRQTDRDRGLAPVLGLTLLIGLVAVASIGIFALGTTSLSASEDTLEDEQVERAFAQLGSDLDTVAASSNSDRSTSLGLENADGDLEVVESGNLTVTTAGAEEPLVDTSLQALEYRDGETVVAYEGGGVFSGSDEATQVVSSPQLEYRDGTFHLPVTTLEGGDESIGTDVALSSQGSEVLTRNAPAIDGRLITVTIESPYYAGWASHLEDTVGADHVTVDSANETVSVILGHPEPDGNYDGAVVATGDAADIGGSPSVDGPIAATGNITDLCEDEEEDAECLENQTVDMRPIDEDIEYLFEGKDDAEDLEGDTIDAGTYYTEELVRSDDLTIDVTDGNVTLLVDGNIALNNAKLEVESDEDTDGVARVYTTGDVAIGGGSGGVIASEPSQFQLYGTSEMMFAIGQESFDGTVYAPRDEPANRTNDAVSGENYTLSNADCSSNIDWPDVCIGTGNTEITGSIVSGPMALGQKGSIVHDDSLEGVEPTIAVDPERLPPNVTHLTVVSHEVAVDSD